MTIEIRVACSPGEIRVAVLDGRTLLDYAIGRPGAPDGVGDLHRGRVCAVMPAMAGVFVALGDGIAPGFLPDSRGGAERTVGDRVAVMIDRAAQSGKGARLTLAAGDVDGPPDLLRRGPDALHRLAARYPDAAILIDDAGIAADTRATLKQARAWPEPAFDSELDDEIAALGAPACELAGGMRMHVNPTPALVAIDIDGGALAASAEAKTSALVRGNLACLPDLARQIRLRDLGGAILIDFAGLSPRRRQALHAPLADALAADPLRPKLLGFTRLGLAEIIRPRVHPPLHEMLRGPHAAGLRALRQLCRDRKADPATRLHLRAAPPVVAALRADPVALRDLAARIGKPISLSSEPGYEADRWTISRR